MWLLWGEEKGQNEENTISEQDPKVRATNLKKYV
jgi:hypothetical protein